MNLQKKIFLVSVEIIFQVKIIFLNTVLFSERVSLSNTQNEYFPEAPMEKSWETLRSLHCDIPWGPNDSKVIITEKLEIDILKVKEK